MPIDAQIYSRVHEPGRKSAILLLGSMMAVGLLIRIYIAGLDLETLFQKVVVDDSFFYLKLARNLALGTGPTFDGEVLTNGFHPIYAALLVPLFWIIDADLLLPVQAALILLSIFNVLTAIAIYRIIRIFSGRTPALLASFIWLFNPYVIMISMSGVEVSIATFCLSLAIYCYAKMRRADRVRVPHLAILGVLLAVAVLARVDAVIMALCIGADFLFSSAKHKRGLNQIIGNAFVIAFAFSVVLSPWWIWSLFKFGTIRQISGVVLPFAAHNMYLAQYHTYLSPHFIKTELYHLVFWLSHIISYGGGAPLIFAAGGLCLGAALFCGETRARLLFAARTMGFTIIYSGLLVAFYALYFWGWLRPWYYLSLMLVVTLWLGIALSSAQSAIDHLTLRLRFLLVSALSLYFAYYGYQAWKDGMYPFQSQLYRAALWVRANTDSQARVGAFSSGIIGYLGGRKVIDLAGVVNKDVHHARLENRLGDYFGEIRLTYLVDREDMIQFNKRFSNYDYGRDMECVARFGPKASDIAIYKLK